MINLFIATDDFFVQTKLIIFFDPTKKTYLSNLLVYFSEVVLTICPNKKLNCAKQTLLASPKNAKLV